MDDLSESNREKDELKQKCHEMEIQINMLKDEKINIASEVEQLQAQVFSMRIFYVSYSMKCVFKKDLSMVCGRGI